MTGPTSTSTGGAPDPFVVQQRNVPTRPADDAGAFVLGRNVFLPFSAVFTPDAVG